MSAICGILFRDGSPFLSKSLRSMMNALAHRGKDGSGIWSNGCVGLGHQSLLIRQEDFSERLPFISPCGRLTITADARIVNRDELLPQLDMPKDLQRTLSDSGLILRAYEKWGEACTNRLEGSFVFAIWDDRKRHMFCAVDALCSKSLYTYSDSRIFAFSTEIKGILALPDHRFRLDETGFAQLAFLPKACRDPGATCFEGVKLMRAATSQTVSEHGISRRTYWEPDYEHEVRFNHEHDYVERFRELFFASMDSCLKSAFPVGITLSGGLDSSSVVCSAVHLQKTKGLPLHAISSVLPEHYTGPEKDERRFIDIVKNQTGIPVRYIHPPVTSICGQMDEVIRRTEDPRFNHSYYLLFAFLKAADQENIRIILSGSGGEIGPSSYGSGYLPELALKGHWRMLFNNLRDLARVSGSSFLRTTYSEALRPIMPTGVSARFSRLRGRTPVSFSEALIAQPDFFYQTMASEGIMLPEYAAQGIEGDTNLKKKEFQIFNTTRLPPSGNALAHDQVFYFPFMDKRLLEYCLALPGDMKIRQGWKRYLLRAGMEGILPSEIQWRKTKGPFSPDFFRRLAASRLEALSMLEDIESDRGLYNYVKTYVNLKKLKDSANGGSSCETWQDWGGFDPAWQILLRGLNIVLFLKWAREQTTTNREVSP